MGLAMSLAVTTNSEKSADAIVASRVKNRQLVKGRTLFKQVVT